MAKAKKTLTADEQAHLSRLDVKLDHVRDAVRGVVKEFHTGLFLHGEGGTSKSYTVLGELEKLKCKAVIHNSRLTARGLVDVLQASPTDIHVVEDAETLMDDKKSFGVLRSALWSQSTEKPIVRPVTWGSYGSAIRFNFTGGLIIISNANLADSIPEIRAIKTRITALRIDVSPEEIKALMAQICHRGFTFGGHEMSVRQCLDVRNFIIEELARLQRPLDLRLLVNGFRDYLQHEAGHSKNHWTDLLRGRMVESTSGYKSRAESNAEKGLAAAAIRKAGGTLAVQVAKWKTLGHGDQASYYRALKRK